jgi:CRP-like cAMP-binding protein
MGERELYRGGNLLLEMLEADDLELLHGHLSQVKVKPRQCLEPPHRKIRAVYFMESGLASVVAIGGVRERQTEVSIIGREGMTGGAIVMGLDRSPHEIIAQVSGTAQCINTTDFNDCLANSPTLRPFLLRYTHVLSVTAAHTALANASGKVDQRLARWLLMAQDRLGGTDIQLTHDFLALMLGTRRAGVTASLNAFEIAGLVACKRRCISITNRKGLEEAAAGLYGIPEVEYVRVFPHTMSMSSVSLERR